MRLKKIRGRTTVRGHATGERLDHSETGESDYCPRSFRKMSHRRTTDTESMNIILI